MSFHQGIFEKTHDFFFLNHLNIHIYGFCMHFIYFWPKIQNNLKKNNQKQLLNMVNTNFLNLKHIFKHYKIIIL